MSKKKVYCQYDCGREAKLVTHNGIPTTCDACYQRMVYAIKQGPSWMIKRARQVGSWLTTLDETMGDVAKAKTKKRRAA